MRRAVGAARDAMAAETELVQILRIAERPPAFVGVQIDECNRVIWCGCAYHLVFLIFGKDNARLTQLARFHDRLERRFRRSVFETMRTRFGRNDHSQPMPFPDDGASSAP